MNYDIEAGRICEAIRMIVCLDTPPNITPEKAVADYLKTLFAEKDKEIDTLKAAIDRRVADEAF